MKRKIAAALCCALILASCSAAGEPTPDIDTPPPSSAVEESSQPQSQPQSSEEESSSSSEAEPPPQTSQPPKIPPEPPKPEVKPETTPPKSDPYIDKLTDIIYKGVKAGPPQRKFIYPVSGDWTNTVLNYSYDTGGQAHLSWKVSWILEGLDYAYRATGDRLFLDKSIEMYDALLSVRDDSIGRTAWDSGTYPLWGSTARYNGAEFTIYDTDGNASAKLYFHCQGNDQNFVSVANSSGGTFDIKIKHQGTLYQLKNLTLDTLESRVKELGWSYYGSPLPSKKVVAAEVFDPYATPSEHDFIRVDNTNVPTVIHTALILEPMVNTYLEMKKIGHPQVRQFRDEIELMFDALLEYSWNEKGYFAEMKNSLTHLGGGYILPWNQQLPLVAAMANYAAAEGSDYYKGIVRRACSYFMTKVQATGTGYLWKYWEDPSGTVTYYETTNYGGIDLSSIASIYNSGVAFTEKDMAMFAATVRGRVLKTPAKPATRIDGSAPNSGNTSLLYKYLPFSDRVSIISLLKNQNMEWENAARMLYYYQK